MPHGYCLRWDASLVHLWNVANIGIAIAYFAIPLALLYSLSAILGMNELLLSTTLTDEQKNYAVKIQSASKSLLTIVNDLLDLSKIESGKMELDCIPLNPHVLVKESVKLLHEAANNKGLMLSVELDGTIPEEVLGDSVRLQRVLLNLIGNAVKFTHKGGIEVAGKLESKADGLAILNFRVTDTGVGIGLVELIGGESFRPCSFQCGGGAERTGKWRVQAHFDGLPFAAHGRLRGCQADKRGRKRRQSAHSNRGYDSRRHEG